MGIERDIRVFGLLKHNASLTATIRIRAYSDSGYSSLVADSGTCDIWKIFYPPDTLPWGSPSLWNGLITVEDQDGYEYDFFFVFPVIVIARYWQVEIIDTDNPAGYFEMSRSIFAPGWQPPIGSNMVYGAQVKWEDDTTVEKTLDSVRSYDERGRYRVCTFRLENLSDDMADAVILEMHRRLGISGELVFIYDPDAEYQAQWIKSFLATMEEMDPVEAAAFNNSVTGFKLVEVL